MSDPDSVARFYGRWAAIYDLLSTRTPGLASIRDRAVDSLGLHPGDTVVEVGCGTGANLEFLRARVGETGRVVGVDLTPEMVARARSRIDHRGWSNVHVVRGDGTRPPFARADAVLATFVVGMFDDPAGAVDAWRDLLGPGGRIALLDAAPRGSSGVLDLAFRSFVALSAPPTRQLRYPDSPARLLGERVETARRAVEERGEIVMDNRSIRGFLRLTAGRV